MMQLQKKSVQRLDVHDLTAMMMMSMMLTIIMQRHINTYRNGDDDDDDAHARYKHRTITVPW